MDVHPVYGLRSRSDIDTPLNNGLGRNSKNPTVRCIHAFGVYSDYFYKYLESCVS